jgi:hypothetical protein
MLATRLSGDRAAVAAMRETLGAGVNPYLADPATAPPALIAAMEAVRGASGGSLARADARAAWDVAMRYSLPD